MQQKYIFLALIIYLISSKQSILAQKLTTASNPVFERKYKLGETYRYRLTNIEKHNGKWSSTVVSVCELHVIKDSTGAFYDEVRWLSETVFSTKDTVDNTTTALNTKKYKISLEPAGKLNLPKISASAMTEPITDFNTFFVAVSPALGATRLQKQGDSLNKKEFVKGNFANGKNILTGEDCLAVSLKMINKTKDIVVIHTAFMPPGQSCLSYVTEDMKQPVVNGVINNFQMIQPTENNKFNLQFGMEWFYINSTVRMSDGKMTTAEMINKLDLKLKVNCDNDYKVCQIELPFKIERKLNLELLSVN